MYGGMCTYAYFNSAMTLKDTFRDRNFAHDWLVTRNESLITRGRNTSAATFMKGDWSRLFFIDADIEFEPEHVAALWNMDADIAVGCYPMKQLGAPYAAWVGGKLLMLDDIKDKTEPFRVDHAGTGFMMIKRKVFEALREAHPEWEHEEGHVGRCWGFFQDPLEMLPDDSGGNLIRVHLPEDYFFCRRANELGFKVMMHPKARLGHWGMHRFDGT
jgi:hypothetical protein